LVRLHAFYVCVACVASIAACGRSTLEDYALFDAGTDDAAFTDARAGEDAGARGDAGPGVDAASDGSPGLDAGDAGRVDSGGVDAGPIDAGARCNAQTCPNGCCAGNACVAGTADALCGEGGQACADCTQSALVCRGGLCVQPPPPPCGPSTCPNGCCSGANVCNTGTQSSACGVGGAACVDFTLQRETCNGNACQPLGTCSGQSCAGCCDVGGNCQGGFLDTQCGQGGAACANCSTQGKLCDTASDPRVCASMVSICPATYSSCPSGVTTAAPTVQHVCSTTDLANARAACVNGAHTPACTAFFQFVAQQNPSCARCLAPFDYDFSEQEGIFACVAPFVDATCDRATGCAFDCETKSCGQCLSGSQPQCVQRVIPGQCLTYFQQASCANQALTTTAMFCRPLAYNVNFGGWLQGVGAHYCGP